MPAASEFMVTLLDLKVHERPAFTCGKAPLDEYLWKRANQDAKRDATRVHVLTRVRNPGTIIGYYTLTAGAVRLTELSPEIQKRLAAYPEVGAILIGRLAVATSQQGQGMGGRLLKHALRRCLAISEDIAVALVVIDALDREAQLFYEHFGFLSLATNPVTYPIRLVLPIATLRVEGASR